ncbi:MAG: VWA domain-containing protein [Vicinamibacterales bacterium]|nr:VWA domain-containing protein [Vicinamibacterales bacterium]
MVVEAASGADSILNGVERNLADPSLGGTVVWSSSEYGAGNLITLLDAVDNERGWLSGTVRRSIGPFQGEQIVIAFNGNREALLDRVVLQQAERSPAFRTKTIAVSVSSDSPLDGFREVGRFELADELGPQVFPLGVAARYVKLHVLDNYGGHRVNLGSVQFIEGDATGTTSVLAMAVPPDRAAGTGSAGGEVDTAATGGAETTAARPDGAPSGKAAELVALAVEANDEVEPNDAPAEAGVLAAGSFVAGTIETPADTDYFDLQPPGPNGVMTFELAGVPELRTAMALTDAGGTVIKEVSPGNLRSNPATLSWAIDTSDVAADTDLKLRVSQPPASIVLIFDTSASMEGSTEDLQGAVAAFIEQMGPGERMNLVRFFDGEPEVLLDEFSGDPDALLTAVDGKFVADGKTPLFDAIATGLGLLEQAPGDRVIVVMTDGADAGSTLESSQVWRLLQQTSTRIHTIGLGWGLKARIPDSTSTGERFLTHLAAATGGRYAFAANADGLEAVYQSLSTELRSPPRYFVRRVPSNGMGSLQVAAIGEDATSFAPGTRLEFVLDASGSMRRELDGEPMIDIAKRVIGEIVAELPEDLQVALRTYGRRVREGSPGDCEDTELLVRFAPLRRSRILDELAAIEALGTTPLVYSLQQAAADLAGDENAVLVVLTDGVEECGGDLVAAAQEIADSGTELRLSIVGFAIDDDSAREKMRRAAGFVDGDFFEARDADGLQQAVRQSLSYPYSVFDAAGDMIARGATGVGEVEIPDGVYTVVVSAEGDPTVLHGLRITEGEGTRIELAADGRLISATTTTR